MGIKWNKKLSIDPIADEIDKTYRKFAINCYNNVKTLSPVDTGRYRNAHHISVGAPSYSETGGDVGLVLAIPKHTYPTIYIQNNLPYVVRIEHGWSGQAPTGVYGNAFNSALGSL